MALGRKKKETGPTEPPCIGCDEDGNYKRVVDDDAAARAYEWSQALRDAGIHGEQRGEKVVEVKRG